MTLAAAVCPWNPSLPLGLRDKEDDPQAVRVEVLTPVSARAWPELCPVGARVPPSCPPTWPLVVCSPPTCPRGG